MCLPGLVCLNIVYFQGVRQVLAVNKLTAGFSKDKEKEPDDTDNKREERSLKSVSSLVFNDPLEVVIFLIIC